MKAIRPSSKFSPLPNLITGLGLLTCLICLSYISLNFLRLLILKGGANFRRFGAEGVSFGLNLHIFDVTSELPDGLAMSNGICASTGVKIFRNKFLFTDESLDCAKVVVSSLEGELGKRTKFPLFLIY